MSKRYEDTTPVETNPKNKTVAGSRVRMNELVMPNDTNPLGNLMGGKLLMWMDICSAIAAQRHCNRLVVTVSVDSVVFMSAIKLGEVVVIEGEVTRAFNTSMEIAMQAWAENMRTGERRLCTTSYYTFVAVDADGRPVPVPPVQTETEFEGLRFEQAAERRDARLELSRKTLELNKLNSSRK